MEAAPYICGTLQNAARKEPTMSEQLTTMFETNEENTTKLLPGTQQLTLIATAIAQNIIKNVNDNSENEDLMKLFADSRTDSNALDKLVRYSTVFQDQDNSWFSEIEEDELLQMMKSQQSKRSRLKSKPMTLYNYRAMLAGAIAENLIRKYLGKDKMEGHSGFGGGISAATFNEEQLQRFAENQDDLAREIRNQQSKISIQKRKIAENEDHSDERLNDLQVGLQQLIEIRTKSAPKDRTWRKKLNAVMDKIITEMTISNLKKDELQALVDRLATMRTVETSDMFYSMIDSHPEWQYEEVLASVGAGKSETVEENEASL